MFFASFASTLQKNHDFYCIMPFRLLIYQCIFLLFLAHSFAQNGAVTDIDGNEYKTIKIGSQTWMAENLKTTTYNDGTPIELVTNYEIWSDLDSAAYCWYNNNIENKDKYGALYNWYAVDTKKLCPKGWYVPSHLSWKILEKELGMKMYYTYGEDRSTNEGSKIAGHPELWKTGALKTDSAFNFSGFCAIPSGIRSIMKKKDIGLGEYTHWWTSNGGILMAQSRYIMFNKTGLYWSNPNKTYGFSVRCVK